MHASSATRNDHGILTNQQQMVRETARQLARGVIAPGAAERDRTASWPHAELKAMSELGFMGMLIPERYGGSESGFLAYCLALEEFAGADAGISWFARTRSESFAGRRRGATGDPSSSIDCRA